MRRRRPERAQVPLNAAVAPVDTRRDDVRRSVAMQIIAHALSLWLRAVQLGDVSPIDAAAVVWAAEESATPRVDAELLVALTWGESRFESSASPRCGVLQVWPADLDLPQSACALWRSSARAGIAAGVVEIETIARMLPRASLRTLLLYRACGGSALRGACDKGWWVDAALARRTHLKGETRIGT